MRVKFNKYERIAGIFVVTAIVGAIASSVGVAIKRGWLETKIEVLTTLKNADGIRIGTQVQMAGLKAGSVTDIELKTDNSILVHFEVKKRYFKRIKKDSVVRVVRPFIIGEKIIDVSVGSDGKESIVASAELPSESTMDIMDLMSGKKLGPVMNNLTDLLENLKYVADSLLDKERTRNLVEIYDQLKPTLQNLNTMSVQVSRLSRGLNRDKVLVQTLADLQKTSEQINQILPAFAEDAPELGKDLKEVTKNLAKITGELQVFLPMLKEVAPEVPAVGRRAIEALNETVVLLKALQKTWMLRSASEDVREEEAKNRKPANK